jgi:antitoxin component YwqK of YwqJK toxin-antitoxin module
MKTAPHSENSGFTRITFPTPVRRLTVKVFFLAALLFVQLPTTDAAVGEIQFRPMGKHHRLVFRYNSIGRLYAIETFVFNYFDFPNDQPIPMAHQFADGPEISWARNSSSQILFIRNNRLFYKKLHDPSDLRRNAGPHGVFRIYFAGKDNKLPNTSTVKSIMLKYQSHYSRGEHSCSTKWSPEGKLLSYETRNLFVGWEKDIWGDLLEKVTYNEATGLRETVDQYAGNSHGKDTSRHGFQVRFNFGGEPALVTEWNHGRVHNGLGRKWSRSVLGLLNLSPDSGPGSYRRVLYKDGKEIASGFKAWAKAKEINGPLRKRITGNYAPHPLYRTTVKDLNDGRKLRIRMMPKRGVFHEETYRLLPSGREILDGPMTRYWPNGKKASVEEFRKGIRHGRDESWLENGQLSWRGNWKDGLKEGRWEYYWPGGKRMSEMIFKNGLHTDVVIYSDWQGKKFLERNYNQTGEVTRETTWRALSKQKYTEIHLNKGQLHGTASVWDIKGKVIAEGVWREGKPWNGICIFKSTYHRHFTLIDHFAKYREGKLQHHLILIDGKLKQYEPDGKK